MNFQLTTVMNPPVHYQPYNSSYIGREFGGNGGGGKGGCDGGRGGGGGGGATPKGAGGEIGE